MEIFRAFISSFQPPDWSVWKDWTYNDNAIWLAHAPQAGSPVRIIQPDKGNAIVLAPDHSLLGHLEHPLNPEMRGLILGKVRGDQTGVDLDYMGPADLTLQQLEN